MGKNGDHKAKRGYFTPQIISNVVFPKLYHWLILPSSSLTDLYVMEINKK